MNLSKEEIQRLSYERFHYPCVKTQKKLHAVYLKASCGYSKPVIGRILSIIRDQTDVMSILSLKLKMDSIDAENPEASTPFFMGITFKSSRGAVRQKRHSAGNTGAGPCCRTVRRSRISRMGEIL
jgi:hypothetical protein